MERLTDSPIDEKQVLREIQRADAGAILTFSGVVRNHHLGRKVRAIDYHGYRPMAVKEIRKLEEEIHTKWPEVEAIIVHRLGPLQVGDSSVLIAVSSPHRDAGFEALRYAIDILKERVPIWKKEIYTDGEAWIEGS